MLLLTAPSARAGGAAAALERALKPLRAARADLAVRVDRWETAMPLAAADAVLKDPLAGPDLVEKGTARLREARGLADLVDISILAQGGCPSDGPGIPPDRGLISPTAEIPHDAADALAFILPNVAAAAKNTVTTAAAMTPSERALAQAAGRLADADGAALGAEEAAVITASRHDVCGLALWAAAVAATIEGRLPSLRAAAQSAKPGRSRWATPFGDVLVAGPGDDEYTASELGGIALLLDLGGRNTYRGAPAAAAAGEVRVVIDLGSDVTVLSSTDAAQGPASGILGIGLLYLANPEGTKTLRGGDVSFGAGLLGVGGLYLAGPAVVESGAFGQGAAAYGAGVVWSSGTGSAFTAELAGQGYATTRGAGLFAHRGLGARFSCGLTRPDPRDEHATLGLCQGAGYGPRGFAGGGLGALSVDGDGAVLRTGYMAQGMGYWRAAGVLALRGDGLSVQGRRYVQGAGVHTGVGALRYEGSSSTFRVWGVGPAFGWDYGVGLFHGLGDGNLLASEWAAARGDVNGVGLARLEGKGWRLALADAGSGALRRNAPSWGLVAADDAAVKPSAPDPWGDVPGAVEDAALAVPPAQWPTPDRDAAARRGRERVALLLAEAEAAAPALGPLKLLDAIAAGGLDAAGPREAAARLIALGPGAAPTLLTRLTPERFDDSLWVRLAFSAWGHGAPAALAAARAHPSPAVRAWRTGALGFTTLRALPLLEKAADDAQWQARRAAALALGTLLSREEGEEPGRLRLLEEAEGVCRRGVLPETPARLGAKRLTDLLGALSLDAYADPADVQTVYQAAANPFDRFGADAPPVAAFLAMLAARPAYADALRAELAAAEALSPSVRKFLRRLLADPEPEVVQAGLTALAQLGAAEDAPRLAAFLKDPRALLREAAAAGLGRMGAAARDTVAGLLAARTGRERALAALAASQSSDPQTLALLERAFADRDPAVRAAALRGLNAVQAPLRGARAAFRPALERLAGSDKDRGVRALAARALRHI